MLPFSVWYAGHRKHRRKIPRLYHEEVRISEKPPLVSECDRGVQLTPASWFLYEVLRRSRVIHPYQYPHTAVA